MHRRHVAALSKAPVVTFLGTARSLSPVQLDSLDAEAEVHDANPYQVTSALIIRQDHADLALLVTEYAAIIQTVCFYLTEPERSYSANNTIDRIRAAKLCGFYPVYFMISGARTVERILRKRRIRLGQQLSF